jgi:hypothetical protein
MPESSTLQVVDGLDVNEVQDGLIVYDPAHDRVHYLNASAAIVFSLCDGTLDAPGIAAALAEAYALSQPVDDEVRDCLDLLRTEGLLR